MKEEVRLNSLAGRVHIVRAFVDGYQSSYARIEWEGERRQGTLWMKYWQFAIDNDALRDIPVLEVARLLSSEIDRRKKIACEEEGGE